MAPVFRLAPFNVALFLECIALRYECSEGLLVPLNGRH